MNPGQKNPQWRRQFKLAKSGQANPAMGVESFDLYEVTPETRIKNLRQKKIIGGEGKKNAARGIKKNGQEILSVL
ncbi:hypothetical protein QQ054_27515 [Oscillatoria amoena NRMC-F 0135]|nr:hypothetical protein [Oscillatoria amoena NRMC-F 0135]